MQSIKKPTTRIRGEVIHQTFPNRDPAVLEAERQAKVARAEERYQQFLRFDEARARREAKVEEQKEADWIAYRNEQFERRTRCYGGERPNYKSNLFGLGYLATKNTVQPRIAIPHTAENDALFTFNEITQGFEVRQMSSATIIDTLRLYKILSDSTQREATDIMPCQGRLMFFDCTGNFYDLAHMTKLQDITPATGQPNKEHIVSFTYPREGELQAVTLPVRDIHCITIANYPDVSLESFGQAPKD